MACFVISGVALFFVGHEERAAFSTHAELVAGFFKVEHRHFLVVEPCGEERCFVHQVFEVCTGKSRSSLSDSLHVDIIAKRNLALLQVNLQNFFTALEVGEAHHNLAVKAARTEECLIDFVDEQNARSVLLAGFKQVTHAGCTHANEHFHEVRTRHAKERHASFACNCAGEERLTRARRANEQSTLRDASTELVILLRVL